MKIHETLEENEIKCHICQEIFKSDSELILHGIQNHWNKKPQCKQCKKTFSDMFRLKVHFLKIHHNIKEYECKDCKKQFYYKYELQHHYLRVHQKQKDNGSCHLQAH